MVKPGGTGSPRLVISARLAPLPPSRSFWSLSPSLKSCTKPMRRSNHHASVGDTAGSGEDAARALQGGRDASCGEVRGPRGHLLGSAPLRGADLAALLDHALEDRRVVGAAV